MKKVWNMRSAFCKNDEVLNTVRKIDPAKNPLYSTDDVGNGRLFADVFGDVCRYNVTTKEFTIYDGKRWKRDEGSMIAERLAKRLAKSLYLYAVDQDQHYRTFVNKLGDRNKRKIMIQDARDFRFVSEEDFDRDPYLINLQNGTLNLKTFEFRDHDPNDLLSKIANVVYDPDAISDEWIRFVDQVMQGDKSKIGYLQTIFGYSLTGLCIQDEFYLLYGSTTRNGKSTMLTAIGYVMGDYGQIMSPDALAQRQRSNPNNEELADLRGTRFVHIEEPSKHMILDSALVKNLTGHTPIKTSRKYEHTMTFDPEFKIFIATNYLPTVTDDTLFSSERVKVVTFDRHFESSEQDRTLITRLKTRPNVSGIFNWMIEGLHTFYDHGTIPPTSVIEASNQYRSQSDKIGNFIEECLSEDTTGGISGKTAYMYFMLWCRSNGYRCENKKNFFQYLKQKELLQNTATIDGKTVRNVITGYALNEDAVKPLTKDNADTVFGKS